MKDEPVFPGPTLPLPVPYVFVLVALVSPLNPNSPVLRGGFQISIVWELLRFSVRIAGHCIHHYKSLITNTL